MDSELTYDDVLEMLRIVETCSLDELFIEFRGVKLHVQRHGRPGMVNDGTGHPGGSVISATASGRVGDSDPAAPSPATKPTVGRGEADGVPQQTAVPAAAAIATPPDPAEMPVEGAVVVTAPMVGVFYRAPAPDQPPFVEAGDIVQPESVVGIIEVMKLMNTVRAGVSGRVLAIHVANAHLVQYGEVLVTIALLDEESNG